MCASVRLEGSLRGRRFRSRSVRSGVGVRRVRVHLRVELHERFLRVVVETGKATLHSGLLGAAEHGVREQHVAQTARGDDLVHDVLLERLANKVSPTNEIRDERVIAQAKRFGVLRQDARFHLRISVVLFVRERETVKERFVHVVRAHEATVIAALALRVRSRHDGEAFRRAHVLADLRNVLALAFKHGLEAHDEVGAEVDLVKQQHRTALHCNKNRTGHEHRFAADETEATEQFVFVRLRREVHADALALQLGADQ